MKLNALLSSSRLRLWLLVLLVGLLTLASYWVLEIVRTHEAAVASALRTRPDYWVENFNYIKILPNGKNDYRIVGSYLEHFPDDDHANIKLPVMTNLNTERPPLTARSERGMITNISSDIDSEVHLYEKVEVNRPQTSLSSHMQLDTEYLLAHPHLHTMETNLPVKIVSGDTITTGIGMQANNDTQQMQVLHDVASTVPSRTAQHKK